MGTRARPAAGEDRALRVGLVSDTHGRLDAALPRLFAGCDLIVHAGDVVGPGILPALAQVAPVRAVRGNCDEDPPLDELPREAVVALGLLTALVLHDLGAPTRPLPAARRALGRHRPQVVIHGHSHVPGAVLEGGVLFVNPGSAGPRRFRLPRAAGLLEVRGRRARVTLVDLEQPALPPLAPPLEAELEGGR